MRNVIKLSDFPANETYVYLEKEYKDSLIRESTKKAGSQGRLANLLIKDIKDLKIKQSTIAIWLIKSNLRLDIIYWLCKFLKKKLYQNKIKAIKGAKTSNHIYLPKLPIKLSIELANILAKLYCDGCIEKNYMTYYCNTSDELISEFKKNMQESFGKIHFKINQVDNKTLIRIPTFLGKLLCEKFKLREHKVPREIMDANGSIKISYLRAVFDDEGSVNKIHGQIRLKMKYFSFLTHIKKLLGELNISTSKILKEKDKRHGSIIYYFLISGLDNFEKFYKTICFTHPRKQKLLKTRLETYRYSTYGKGKAKKKILNILKQEGPKTLKNYQKY